MAYVEVVEEQIEDVIQVGTPARAADGVKMGTLIKNVQDKVTRLVKAEIELAKVELMQKLKDSAAAIAMFVAAAMLLLFVFTLLLGALVTAFAATMPLWGAFLLVALILLLIAGVLALLGKRFLAKSQADKFDAPNNIKTDLNRIKFALHRHRVKVKVREDLIVPLAEVGTVGVVGQPSVVSEDVVERVVVEPAARAERTAVVEVGEPVATAVVSESVVGQPTVVSETVIGPPTVVVEEAVPPRRPLVFEPSVVSEVVETVETTPLAVGAPVEEVVAEDEGILGQIVISDDDERSN